MILGLGWRRFSAGVRVNERVRVESKHRLFNILSVLCYETLRSIGKGGWNYIQSQWDPCIINIVDWIKTCLINKLSPVILAIHVVGLRFYINSKNQLLKIYKLMIITDDITPIWLGSSRKIYKIRDGVTSVLGFFPFSYSKHYGWWLICFLIEIIYTYTSSDFMVNQTILFC